MFALHMAHGMYTDQFKDKEWDLFTGLIVSDIKSEGQRPDRDVPHWVDPDRTSAMALLNTTLPQVYQSFSLQVRKLHVSHVACYITFKHRMQCVLHSLQREHSP